MEDETPESENADGAIQTEINTEIEFDEEGTVYAVQTVVQGDRRVDWKIGHIDGTFAEGIDYYYEGELFERTEFTAIPENAPSGRYKDETFHELKESDMTLADGELTVTKVYDAEGVDAAEWGVRYLEGSMSPETVLEEWWEDQWSMYTANREA